MSVGWEKKEVLMVVKTYPTPSPSFGDIKHCTLKSE